MLEVNGWLKFTEEDNYEEGCLLGTSQTHAGNDVFTADDPKLLLASLMAFANCDDESAVMINACGEPGRVDIQVVENADGVPASKNELERFKAGDCRLWLCEYSFIVKQVERLGYEFENIEGFENQS